MKEHGSILRVLDGAMMRRRKRGLKVWSILPYRGPGSVGGCVYLSFLICVQASWSWTLVTGNAEFSPRDTAEGVVYDGKMWLSNGYYHGNVLTRDLWNSEDGESWTRVNDSTPYDGYSEMAVFEDKMWAVKGSVWSSTDGLEWIRVLDRTPFGERGYGELLVHKNRMWQLGSGPDVWSSTDGQRWIRVLEQAPYGDRSAAAGAVHDGKIWLLGGRTVQSNDPPEKGYKDFTTYNDVWCSEDGVDWKRVSENAPWNPRMWFPALSYADRLWIVGGFDNANNTNLGDVWYTKNGIDWSKMETETTFTPRHEPTCYVFKDRFWTVAGNSWPVLNDVWVRLQP